MCVQAARAGEPHLRQAEDEYKLMAECFRLHKFDTPPSAANVKGALASVQKGIQGILTSKTSLVMNNCTAPTEEEMQEAKAALDRTKAELLQSYASFNATLRGLLLGSDAQGSEDLVAELTKGERAAESEAQHAVEESEFTESAAQAASGIGAWGMGIGAAQAASM